MFQTFEQGMHNCITLFTVVKESSHTRWKEADRNLTKIHESFLPQQWSSNNELDQFLKQNQALCFAHHLHFSKTCTNKNYRLSSLIGFFSLMKCRLSDASEQQYVNKIFVLRREFNFINFCPLCSSMPFPWVLSLSRDKHCTPLTRSSRLPLGIPSVCCFLGWTRQRTSTTPHASCPPGPSPSLLPFLGHSLIVFCPYIVVPKTTHNAQAEKTQCRAERDNLFPSLDGSAGPGAPEGTVGVLSAATTHCWLMFNLPSTRTPDPFP